MSTELTETLLRTIVAAANRTPAHRDLFTLALRSEAHETARALRGTLRAQLHTLSATRRLHTGIARAARRHLRGDVAAAYTTIAAAQVTMLDTIGRAAELFEQELQVTLATRNTTALFPLGTAYQRCGRPVKVARPAADERAAIDAVRSAITALQKQVVEFNAAAAAAAQRFNVTTCSACRRLHAATADYHYAAAAAAAAAIDTADRALAQF